jgi:hypothetical protein
LVVLVGVLLPFGLWVFFGPHQRRGRG